MKKLKKELLLMLILCMGFMMVACEEEPYELPLEPPVIEWESENSTYEVKIGRTLTINPVYTNVEDAVFAWKINGKIVSTDSILTYVPDLIGDVYVTLDVLTKGGTAYAEAKIRVVDLAIPIVTIPIPMGGYKVLNNKELSLDPIVENNIDVTYSWFVNGTKVSNAKEYLFKQATAGVYTVKVVAVNEDGSDEFEFDVTVCTPDQMPFNWSFESEEFNLSQGRSIRLKAWDIENDFGGEYTWKVNGQEKQKGDKTEFVFNSADYSPATSCEVVVTMKNEYQEISQTLTVNICPQEGTYKRTATASSVAKFEKVYEFLAAPGQFINENYTANTMEAAVSYAQSRMNSESYVSLGGFGGYIVMGFDHSIENDGGYNIQIMGNSFDGSSEPGIVWVMQDENGDGLPNDTWYELKGSEYGKADCEIRDYCVTYYRPKAQSMPVNWSDNLGNTGSIDYLASFHTQAYYYPAWVKEDSYVLRGTCLVSKNKETSPGYWYNGSYDWGYADNFSNIDRLTNDDNYNANANGNHFKISDAVTFDGKPANLQYIDFVKVVCGTNAKSGWLGEVSTEIFGCNDYNMLKK